MLTDETVSAEPRIDAVELDRLIGRAERQLEVLERLRQEATTRVLG